MSDSPAAAERKVWDGLAREFAEDALELLAEMDLGLLKLQAGGTQSPVVDHLFRLIHSIKGNAGFFGGFIAVRRVAHAMEDVLDGPRRGGRPALPVEQALLTAGSALLRRELQDHLAGAAGDPREPGADAEGYCNRVRELRTQPEAAPIPAAAVLPAPVPLLERVPTIKVEAAGLVTLGRELQAVREGLAELARAAPAAAVLEDRVAGLTRLLSELRTVPLHRLFDRLPAMVGSLARTLGRSVSVQTEGGELRVDRGHLELLDTALAHLIRNALDHGIESQDVRTRRGKPAVGHLGVCAARVQHGTETRLQLQVQDDGGGIDPKRMRLHAVTRDLLTEAEAAALSDEEAIALVFRPGFSTAPAITDLSGRGVGMDAVRTSVRQAGGEVHIRSRPRQGTTIVLDLPAS